MRFKRLHPDQLLSGPVAQTALAPLLGDSPTIRARLACLQYDRGRVTRPLTLVRAQE